VLLHRLWVSGELYAIRSTTPIGAKGSSRSRRQSNGERPWSTTEHGGGEDSGIAAAPRGRREWRMATAILARESASDLLHKVSALLRTWSIPKRGDR
jgi:hypothetical protein